MKKCQALRLLLLWIFLPTSLGIDAECATDKCTCFRSYEYEYQCPPANFDLVMHTIPGKYVKIDCYNVTEYNLDIFPDVQVGDIEYFLMRFCPLPNSFSPTLEKFNISMIKTMQLENDNASFKTVTKDLFKGLSTLEKLSFSFSAIKFQVDSLENLPNLIQLFLDKNGIEELDYMFNYTSKLQVLHLSRNSINRVPDGLFQNLTNLKELHLWKNELTNLTKNAFIGLSKLKSLELNTNKISFLEEDTFSELKQLENISLRANKLQFISPNIFKHNSALLGIRIGYNPNLKLPDYVFANLTNLKKVDMDTSNLNEIPEHIFEGCINLEELAMQANNITQLPNNIFKHLSNLRTINLSENKITIIPNDIFSSVKNLEQLNLGKNNISIINEEVFKNVPNLKKLILNKNKITTVDISAFTKLTNLVTLDLSYNHYSMKYGKVFDLNPFSYCENLEDLNLAYNLIDVFPEGIILNKVKLKSLNLRHNRIESLRVAGLINVSPYEVNVDLTGNNITFLDFQAIKGYTPSNQKVQKTVVDILENPINCDCSSVDFVRYIQDQLKPVIKTVVDIRVENLQCFEPRAFEHMFVKELKPHNVTCPLETSGCPKICACKWRPYDETVVVDCSYRNMTQAPIIHLPRKIEMNLTGNKLEYGPTYNIGYDNVTKLLLSHNEIKNLSWIPSKLEVLKLNGNQLEYIDSSIINILNNSKTIRDVSLDGNPWRCTCSSANLQNYLRNRYKIVNTNDVVCEDNGELLINRKELCKSKAMLIMVILLPILVVLCGFAVIIALYFYYQEEIKVWLYAKNLCLWFVTEEELDKDKVYDVFISYSHKDEDFVLHNLLPLLESGPNPFKVCIHVRDWIPGEFITTQITNSVLKSRRTLVILSDNFIESIWGKMEFRTAHTQAIQEGRARVIVVKYGKLNEEKLDEELKTYLKTNTYLQWGDPWFWNKLKYAMPHSQENKFYKSNQKHANIMLKIDDKFELVTSSPTPQPGTTPPVMSLDPALLKNHPLNFNPSINAETPPAEAPLIVTR